MPEPLGCISQKYNFSEEELDIGMVFNDLQICYLQNILATYIEDRAKESAVNISPEEYMKRQAATQGAISAISILINSSLDRKELIIDRLKATRNQNSQ